MEAFDVYGLPLPTPPSAISDRGRTPSSRLKEEKGGEKEEKEKLGKKGKTGKETGMRSAVLARIHS